LSYNPRMVPKLPVSASLLCAVAVQVACQAFKVVLYSVRERRLALSWFISAGGMPSAHSAFVSALAVSIGLWNGFGSDLFAVAGVFSVIIVYDAWRLRGAVAHQARVLRQLAAKHPEMDAAGINVHLGHTLPEIAAGLAAGGGLAAAAYLLLRLW
jgi:acid phosphatase family membrane protein YuiD